MMLLFTILMSVFAEETVRKIELHEIVTDAIDAYDYKVYRLDITNPDYFKDRILVVTLLPQIGNPKVAVDCDTQPKLFDYYEWQTSSWSMQQLSISSQERQTLNCTNKAFFIGVSSEEVSGYQLVAYLLDGIQILEYNIPLSGELVQSEILQFKLIPEKEPESITLQINANQVDVYLKQCFKEECSITQEDYDNNDTDTGIHLQQSSISFLHNEKSYYLVGLKGNQKISYRVMAKHNESHVQLREGQTDQFIIEEGFYAYYQYNIPNDANIKSVKFQLTSYNGSYIMYGSTINQYPNITNNEISSPQQVQVSGGKIYYLSVYGITHCSFGLYTQVERYQTINQTHFLNLQSGLPQSYLQNELYSYFYIKLTSLQNLTINLQTSNGSFIMYVKSDTSNKEVPDSNSYQWKDERQIQINTNDQYFSSQYYIGVQKMSEGLGSFMIQYSLSDDIQFYQVGQQIIGTVQQNQYHYYKLPMSARDLMITKDVYSKNDVTDLDLYISLKDSNTHPNIQISNYALAGKNLTIPEEELKCIQNGTKISERKICYIYLTVTSLSGTIFYTITTKYNNSRIQLYEGYPQTLTFEEPTLFYYLLHEKEVSVQWYSFGGSSAEIQAWYGDLDTTLKFDSFKPINAYGQFQNILIPPTQKHKVLFVQVTPNQIHFENETYTIGIYEDVKLLTSSDPLIDSSIKGQMKYYRVVLTEDVKSIVFSLHILGGEGYLTPFVTKGKDSRPDQQNSLQLQQFGSFIILQQDGDSKLQKDDYILGLYGQEEDCDYQVSYNLDDAKFQYAFMGYPFDVIFKDNVPHYYMYNTVQDQTFKIIIIAIKGTLRIKVKKANDDQIESDDITFIDSAIQGQKQFKINNCDKTICQYLVEIIAVDGDCQGLLEFSDDKYQVTLYNGLQWSELLNESESVDYRYHSFQSMQISVYLITGDIRLYVKEGSILEHSDDADLIKRIQNDTQIIYEKKTNNRDIIIRVECLSKQAYYKISVQRMVRNVYTLHLSQMTYQTIRTNETSTFQYQSITQNNNDSSKYIMLQIQCVKQPIENLFIEIKHTNISPINYFHKYSSAIVYHLYDQFGLYEINITAKNNSFIRVIMTNGEMSALIDGVSQYQLAKVGQPNYYEVFIQQKSQIFLEAFTCTGTILIQGTKNQTNLAKQVFEIQVMNSSQEHVQSILTLEQGIYYFLVKLISSHTQDENKNKISSYYIQQQTFDHGSIIPQTAFEYKSSINWYKVDDKLIIYIPKLEQLQKDLNIVQIYFIVRIQQGIGEKSLACMFESNYVNSKTNIYGKYTQLINQSKGNVTTATFVPKDHQTKYLSVVGKVQLKIGDEVEELTYPLPIIEMNYTTTNQQQSMQEWILLAIFLVILFLTGLFIYKNIQRQVSHQDHNSLNIEMNYQTFNN